MKRCQAFPGTFLGKDDLPEPITATIAAVQVEAIRVEHGTEDKPVMTFTDEGIKPLILNNVNWGTLEDAYGEESDNWHSKPVEIYVDPSVMFGGRRVGGVRIRIPAQTRDAAPTNANPRNSAPANTPSTPVKPTLADRHAQALDGMGASQSLANLNEWAQWSKGFPFTAEQKETLSDAYQDAKERLTPPATARRPATARA